MFKSFIKHTPFGISLILILLAAAFLFLILPVFGNKTLIVRSGSMSPAIGVGDLIFVFPKTNYKVGDIIAFNEAGNKPTTITHRIAEVKNENGQIRYLTKGDANKLPDQTLVPKGNVLGSASYSVKGLGKIFAQVKTKNGIILTAIIPAFFVIVLEMVNIINSLKKPKTRYAPSAVPVSAKMPSLITQTAPAIPPLSSIPLTLSSTKSSHSPMGLHFQSASLKSLIAIFREKINFQGLKPNAGLPYYATSYKAILPYAILVIIFVGTTYAATYSDSEISTGNSFQAANSYPSPTPPTLTESTQSAQPGQ